MDLDYEPIPLSSRLWCFIQFPVCIICRGSCCVCIIISGRRGWGIHLHQIIVM